MLTFLFASPPIIRTPTLKLIRKFSRFFFTHIKGCPTDVQTFLMTPSKSKDISLLSGHVYSESVLRNCSRCPTYVDCNNKIQLVHPVLRNIIRHIDWKYENEMYLIVIEYDHWSLIRASKMIQNFPSLKARLYCWKGEVFFLDAVQLLD